MVATYGGSPLKVCVQVYMDIFVKWKEMRLHACVELMKSQADETCNHAFEQKQKAEINIIMTSIL